MSIQALQRDEIDKAVELCVSSFIDHDSLVHYSYGSSPHKKELLTHLFNHHIYYSDLEDTEMNKTKHKENMRSVALIFPAGSPWPLEEWNIFSKEHVQLISALGNDTMKSRFEALENWFDDEREELNQIDSYYIVLVATDNNHRKKGYASKLIKHVLALADTNGKDCYLECSEIENIPYYEKFGFQTIKKASPPKDPQESNDNNDVPTLWFMVRPTKQ